MTEPAHILIVDDDSSIRRMFQILLGNSGYRVSTAGSGEEALAYLDLVTPDLILLDMNLPGINGQEVTERIKADTSKPFIPIMLVTARGDQKSKVSGLDAGADDFLVKPVDLTELLARVRAMLRLQRSQRSLRAEQRKTELLLHLTRELGTTLDLDQLLTHFLDRLADAVGAIRASIILVSQDRPQLYSSTRNRPMLDLGNILRDGIAGWVLREREAAIIDDTRTDPRWIAPVLPQQAVRSVAAVPIIREGRALGVITLVHHTPGYFSEADLDLLNSVAAQSAIALENAELFRLTRSQKDLLERRTEELQRLNQVSRHLTELMLPDQLIRLVVHLIHHMFGYQRVAILLRDNNDLIIRAAAGPETEEWVGTRHPEGEGVAAWAVANLESVCIGDVREDGRYIRQNANDHTLAVAALPIHTARDVFGALAVMSDTTGAFGSNDVRLLGTLAGQLGIALENAHLFNTEQHRVRQLDRVNNLSLAITAQLDLNENLRIAAEAITTIFGCNRCSIVVSGDPLRGGTRVAEHNTIPLETGSTTRFLLPTQQLATAIELRAPVLITDIATETPLASLAPAFERASIEALVLAPLISSNRQIGMIVIDATNHQHQFVQGELALVETVASLIAQVMENARLYREVEDERGTLGAVLRGAADPILLIGPRDQLLLANPAAQERLGLGNGTGEQLSTLLPNPELLHLLGTRNGNGSVPITSQEVTLSKGETFSVSVAPVRGADEALIGRVAVLQDITPIKELERREQERLREVFRRYVSPQVVEEVLAGGGAFGEPDERDVVVVISDLRGYTSLTEGMEPRVLVEQVLNRYFTAMTEVLYRHGGTIDKFLGDGIIGLFGVPIARPDDIQRSLAAAVDLQLVFAGLRRQWKRELGLDIGMGIGMGYGRAVVGNIGSAQRLDYTVIGDVVNTASRLNGLAQPDQIIVSYHLVDALAPGLDTPGTLRPIGPVMLKGKLEPHLLYEVEYKSQSSQA